MDKELDVRNNNELVNAIALAQHTVYKRFLSQLDTYPIVEPTQILLDEKTEDCVLFSKLKKLTCKKGEDIYQKLSTVYHASMSLGCSLVLMIDVERRGCPADIYLGVRNSGVDTLEKKNLSTSHNTLIKGLKSNFPGTVLEKISSRDAMPNCIDSIFDESARHLSSVSCIASARDKSKTENKTFIQGIERFIDAMQGERYTAVFIAEPVSDTEQALMRSGYENLYSTLSSFRKSVWSYNENESYAVMDSLSKGISNSISDGTSFTQAHTVSVGANIGVSGSHFNSNSVSSGKTKPDKISLIGTGLQTFGPLIGTMATAVVGPMGPVIGTGVSTIGMFMQGRSVSDVVSSSSGQSSGINGGLNVGYGNTKSDSVSHNETDSTSETKTRGTTSTSGKGRTLQIENVNKTIDELIYRIEEQLKRVHEAEDYGSYSCGSYFLSPDSGSCRLAANTYRALMIGEKSSVESGAINYWDGNKRSEDVEAIKQYLKRFVHPLFAMKLPGEEDAENIAMYTPGTIVSGLELPIHLGLPSRSVYGLPVVEYAEFGRNIHMADGKYMSTLPSIRLGKVCVMGQTKDNPEVRLSIPSLASHTFISGSTGSGKTNAIYQILDKSHNQGIHFLVIEPAKGEYKHIFGNRSDVRVFGTNPAYTPMLKINPFKVPYGIHVLEHVDRLIEIFNVCWPMYAAMPAVLKESVEKAYEDCGWVLTESTNVYGDNYYPSFSDVARNVKQIIETSEYDTENKGAYKGSLLTRLRALTNGINGMIFSNEEIPDKVLFGENVIVDLSRIGSMETKSLIMGMLILRLQEYRLSSSNGMNKDLNHITVLEEAHHILKRTSQEMPTEGSNILGKSVEMISNSIAEMRAYGEGFIIADQAPGLLDPSAIRNTNTKIIMRLPDHSDRNLVGKAASLNDDQIVDLSKLPTGVAAIYQNEWIQPVLCKIDEYTGRIQEYHYSQETTGLKNEDDDSSFRLYIASLLSSGSPLGREIIMTDIRERLLKTKLDASIQIRILKKLLYPPKKTRMTDCAPIINALFPEVRCAVKESYVEGYTEKEWTLAADAALNSIIGDHINEEVRRDIIQGVITNLFLYELNNRQALEDWRMKGGLR